MLWCCRSLVHSSAQQRSGAGACSVLTIHVVDLEEKLEFVHLRPVGEDGQSIHQLLEANGAVAVLVKQLKEAVGKEALVVSNTKVM